MRRFDDVGRETIRNALAVLSPQHPSRLMLPVVPLTGVKLGPELPCGAQVGVRCIPAGSRELLPGGGDPGSGGGDPAPGGGGGAQPAPSARLTGRGHLEIRIGSGTAQR